MRITQKKGSKERAGQGIVEYMVLMAAVIMLMIIFFRSGGYFSQVYNDMIDHQGTDMLNVAVTLF